jgi:NADP-dependent 3-hydroxy acid dehydrogenase YdfG/acyl carrier protein
VIRPDAAYLLTGGFGAIGQAVARSLVAEGARHLWIIGRSGPGVVPLPAELEEQVTIRSAALDVADAPALVRQIEAWEADGTPLRGVVHAAGSTGRTRLGELVWDDILALARPKVLGTWALAQAVAGRRLDFFACCSSIAALWGGQEQAAYAAANAFLDGFAHYRAAAGLPATSIALGPVSGTGLVPDAVAAVLQRMGLRTVPLDRVATEIRRLLAAAKPHVALAAADFPRFAALHGARSQGGLFDELVPREASPNGAMPGAMPGTERIEGADAILTWLTEQVAASLHLPAQFIDPELPLLQLGLDSLTAMELRTRLQQRLNVTVPLPDLLGEHGLGSLAMRLAASATDPPVPAEAPLWIAGEI